MKQYFLLFYLLLTLVSACSNSNVGDNNDSEMDKWQLSPTFKSDGYTMRSIEDRLGFIEG